MLAGLQGASKTTLAGKLAKWLKGQGHTPLLVACDLQTPGPVNQLKIVGERAGVVTFAPASGYLGAVRRHRRSWTTGDPVAVAAAGLNTPKSKLFDVVIVDTAGRLGIDDVLMAQAAAIRDAVQADETLFVLDAMIGQGRRHHRRGIRRRRRFHRRRADQARRRRPRRCGAVGPREITGVPILFASTGEKLEDFDVFHPTGWPRILAWATC